MEKHNVLQLQASALVDDPLTEILRQGARKLLAQAVQEEVSAFINEYAHLCDENGRVRIVRNG